jgi:hypothetical protein
MGRVLAFILAVVATGAFGAIVYMVTAPIVGFIADQRIRAVREREREALAALDRSPPSPPAKPPLP